MTNTYILSNTSSDFTTSVKGGSINLNPNKNYEASLLSLDMFNSIPNIIEGKNNMLRYFNGIDWKMISILTGSYELTSINNEIQRQMSANGDYNNDSYFVTITANESRGTSIINITHKDYLIDFNIENSIGSVLGFKDVTNGALCFGYHESPFPVDIIHINSILVNIDIIQGSYVNQVPSPVIHSFYPKVPFGYKIIEHPSSELVWYPIGNKDLSRIRLWLTDQDGKPIDTRGERLTVRIQIREVKNRQQDIIEAIKFLKKEKII